MPWTTITINRNPANPAICEAAAVFDDGTGFVFGYSKTVTFDTAGKNDYVASAKAALSAAQSKRTAEKSIEATVLAALNA
jgi:hypothetical protein